MNIALENKSNKTLFISLNNQSIVLNPFGKEILNLKEKRVSLNLTTEDNYSYEKYAAKAGYYCCHGFITISQYDFTAESDFTLKFYVETKRGDHFESYQRVLPYCEDFTLPEPIYTLKNETEIKEKFILNEKLEAKADRRAGFLLKADNIGTTLSSIFLILLAIGLGGIIFLSIWTNFSLKAAVITLALIISVIYLIYKITGKLVNRVGKTAKKALDSKFFNEVADKANEKFEEKYVYCKAMPTDLFKDRNSFFDPTYIGAVFKYSNKNI